jgi:hypothetical protein
MMEQPLFLYPNTPYLPTATVSATDSYAGTSPASLLTATEDAYWRPADTAGTKTITIDLGEPRPVTALGLAGEAMDGATFTVSASSDNFIAETVVILTDTILTAPVNAGWLDLDTGGTYRYWQITVATFGSAFRLSWVCLCEPPQLPWFSEDWDPENLAITAEDLYSAQGLFLGTNQGATERALTVNFGQVSTVDFLFIKLWVDQCLRVRRPFIMVPDASSETAYFGMVKDKTFSAALVNGLLSISSLTFMTRGN